jgi:hypothetical protein
MTVSHFEALESEIPVVEARRQMQAAQAAVYPHLTKEGAERLWQAWSAAAYRPAPEHMVPARDALFTLNGTPVSFEGLRQGLTQMLEPGGLAA